MFLRRNETGGALPREKRTIAFENLTLTLRTTLHGSSRWGNVFISWNRLSELKSRWGFPFTTCINRICHSYSEETIFPCFLSPLRVHLVTYLSV